MKLLAMKSSLAYRQFLPFRSWEWVKTEEA